MCTLPFKGKRTESDQSLYCCPHAHPDLPLKGEKLQTFSCGFERALDTLRIVDLVHEQQHEPGEIELGLFFTGIGHRAARLRVKLVEVFIGHDGSKKRQRLAR